MRRFFVLAVIMALGGWALKRLTEVGNDDVCYKGARWSTNDNVHLESQPPDDSCSEPLGASDEETYIESEVTEDLADEKPLSSDEEVPLESQPTDAVYGETLEAPNEEIPSPKLLNDRWGEMTSQSPDEEADLQSQPAEEEALDVLEDRAPSDLDAAREERSARSGATDEWSLPVGPDGEEKLRRTRSEVDKRLRNLPPKRKPGERHAA